MRRTQLAALSLLSGVGLVVGGVAIPSAIATQQSTCSITAYSMGTISAGGGAYELHGTGSAKCSADATYSNDTQLTVSVYHNYDFFSDPRVAYGSKTVLTGGPSSHSWSASATTCDNETLADYYTTADLVGLVGKAKSTGNKHIQTC